MEKLERIQGYAKTLKLPNLEANLLEMIEKSGKKDATYQEFLYEVLKKEIDLKDEKAKERRLKNAGFPMLKTLEDFDLNFQNTINNKQLKQLSEMDWIDRLYNLIFLGPPGVGKTHLGIALGYQAVEMGYKVCFTTMDHLMHDLKAQDISRKSKGKINRILSAQLVLIDELGYLPITREEANLFFQLLSTLHEQTSLIITSNKGLEDWTELLGDPALTTAVLDRLTYRCELFNFTGESYRLAHRKSLF